MFNTYYAIMSISVRLREAIAAKSMTIKKFSLTTGIAYRTLQGYLANDREPDADKLAKIYAQAGINIGWLLTGKGEMFMEERKEAGQPTADVCEPAAIYLADAPKERIKAWLDEFWTEADAKRRAWLEVQIEDHLPQYRDWLKKQNGCGASGRDAGVGAERA
jgi:transcriptional regulator with XRE-family HTH domain